MTDTVVIGIIFKFSSLFNLNSDPNLQMTKKKKQTNKQTQSYHVIKVSYNKKNKENQDRRWRYGCITRKLKSLTDVTKNQRKNNLTIWSCTRIRLGLQNMLLIVSTNNDAWINSEILIFYWQNYFYFFFGYFLTNNS